MRIPRRPRALGALISALALAIGVAGCTNGSDRLDAVDNPGYVVSAPLVTTNAASSDGASVDAQLIAARVYPGAYTRGPAGQTIPNTDLVEAHEVSADPLVVDYSISDTAVFSDGSPITCTDFLLSYTAGIMNGVFDAHLPLAAQVERFDCEPDAKQFRLTYQPGQGARWRYLFGPGEVLPAHVIAEQAGLTVAELNPLLHARDADRLGDVGRAWKDLFRLDRFADNPERSGVSSGPYRVAGVGERGEVVLEANPRYYGDAPNTPRVTFWPASAMGEDVAKDIDVVAVDARDIDTSWLAREGSETSYTEERRAGVRTDSLQLGVAGVFNNQDARQAFAACVDQQAVAGISAEHSGVEVPALGVRVTSFDDPMRYGIDDINSAHLGVDVEKARSLAGQTVRIGYLGPNPRFAAMVAAIAARCGEAGITVVDASSEAATMAGLAGRAAPGEDTFDAYLRPIDPLTEYGFVGSDEGPHPAEFRAGEEKLWETVFTIPLSAEPRSFIMDSGVQHLCAYTGAAGVGWNIDRWVVPGASPGGA